MIRGEFLTDTITLPTTEQTDATKLAILTAQLCEDKIANDVFVINLQDIETAPSDYFVICTCDSGAQVDAICELILRQAKDYKLVAPKVEGREAQEWVLIDFFDVVVHVMIKKIREILQDRKALG